MTHGTARIFHRVADDWATPHRVVAPIPAHAREYRRHLSPPGRHHGGRRRRGQHRPRFAPALPRDPGLVRGVGPAGRRSPLGPHGSWPHLRDWLADGVSGLRRRDDVGRLLGQDGARRPVARERLPTNALGDGAQTGRLQRVAWLPSNFCGEPRVVVRRSPGGRTAPLDPLSVRPTGISVTGAGSLSVNTTFSRI